MVRPMINYFKHSYDFEWLIISLRFYHVDDSVSFIEFYVVDDSALNLKNDQFAKRSGP